MVDRIEVVRGAQSSIYGSDALAGVINIITRRPQAGHNQEVRGEWGQDDYSDSANLRLGWQPSGTQELSVRYRYLDSSRSSYPEQGGGPKYAVSDALDHSDYTQDILAMDWDAQLSSLWRSTVTVSRFEQQERYRSPGISPYIEVPPNAADTDFTREQLRWVNTLRFAPGYEANVGAEYRHEDGRSSGYLEYFGTQLPTGFELDRTTRGAFADLPATPLADLLLHSSLRYDQPEAFDSKTSMQAGAQYTVGSGVTLAANWGEAYKLPSFFCTWPRPGRQSGLATRAGQELGRGRYLGTQRHATFWRHLV